MQQNTSKDAAPQTIRVGRASRSAAAASGLANTVSDSSLPTPNCRLLKPRSRKTYYVNPSSLNPELDIRVEIRVMEEGRHRQYDHYGLLDASYFESAQLLLKKQIDSPCKFDVFAFDRMVEQPVYQFGMFLFDRCGFFRTDGGLTLDPVIVGWLLQRISGMYHYRNPYHNQLHAIDVTQAFYVMLQQPGILRKFHLNQLEVFTTLLAALCHDVDHPGCTAKYLCLFNHNHFFRAYNDRFSQAGEDGGEKQKMFTLENHHTRIGCSLLLQSGLIEALGLTPNQRASTVRLMSDLINATDMDRHKSLVEKFQADLLRAEEAKHAGTVNDDGMSSHTRTVKMDLLELIIKCADIGNPFRDWHICSAWAELVCQEFYRQGDLEELCKKHFMSSTEVKKLPLFTGSLKRTTQVAFVQLSFITAFVVPLIQVFTKVEATDSSKVIQDNVELNFRLWSLLNQMNREKVLDYLGPAVNTLAPDQVEKVVCKFLSEQSITLIVRSVQ